MSDNVCNSGYDDLDDHEYNMGEEYHEADGDCVEEEYYYEDENVTKNQDEDEKGDEFENEQYEYPIGEEAVDLHGEAHEDNVVFSTDGNLPDDEECVAEDREDCGGEEEEREDQEKEEEEDTVSHDQDERKDEEQEDEDKSEEKKSEDMKCSLSEEEIHAEYVILDGFQRQIDEEQYTLRKLRSIIGHQTDDIERLRRKIAGYTKEAEDRKAMHGMEKLKLLKAEREAAVEERRKSTDAQAELRSKRNNKIEELKEKGLHIDPKATYLIEDKELKNLLANIKSTLKYNSFATLKVRMDELEEIIFNVANVCDEIDDFLTTKEIKPRDINKLNTKERRVNVLYDKLIKWRQYKVENPDIRPTDYESFMYDPEDMFSENEEDKKKEKAPPRREIRAVRGGSSDKSPVKERAPGSRIRTPVRAPSPSPRKSSPVRPERRAVRGGSDDEGDGNARYLRAEREGGLPSGIRRGNSLTDARKRRQGPIEGGPTYKKRNMSPIPSRRSRISPSRSSRDASPRFGGRRQLSPKEERRATQRNDRQENTRIRNTPLLRTPNSSNYETRRSPSPTFQSGRRENFQISVKNESFRSRSPVQERGYRNERQSPDRSPPRSSSRGSFRGSRGRGFDNHRRPNRGRTTTFYNSRRNNDSYSR